ncbi:nitroreductase/quinone reductase family protein [Kineococcus rhizosphaerae]|uniref:Deazaflavin-dependent oxidoreductase (Nitroreductase family) n=1 Tax=Kineococcus rhizosphaerae TaxID=559628 RepID=A0A2T0R5K7_9ACTN|nr:nitroreductase/quinone reductase family protein [Kineococcus rhizosphaerae]PRY16053.1 deazaflavin-dependent oxidoreductase (nitroreductase family) [Kineococcus rhizosphaerae]
MSTAPLSRRFSALAATAAPGSRTARFVTAVSRAHVRVHRATGGRLGGAMGPVEIALLTTTGRRSGAPRTSALACFRFPEFGDQLVLVASNAGAARHPAWFHNALAHPDVRLERRGRSEDLRARPATEAERAVLWPLVVAAADTYAAYQELTDRRIPLLLLEPRPAPRTAAEGLQLLAELGKHLDGDVHLPGTPRYAELAAPWNVTVPVTPAAVVAARSARDVAAAVRTAGSLGLTVAVQRTGHGACPVDRGTLLVHTGGLDGCSIDPVARTARVGAGSLWTGVVAAAAEHGLAAPCGSAPGVGVAGFLTGGGLGPLARTIGPSSDLVRAFDVVTGDGELRHVTPETEPDLFWGLRGGKATLGIVTAVEVELLPITEVLGGALWFAAERAGTVLHRWARWCADLPTQATTSVVLAQLPPLPDLPPALAGRSVVGVRFVWTGGTGDGERLLEPLRELAPVLDTVAVMPYAAIGSVHADPTDPVPATERSGLLTELPPAAVDALLAVAGPDSGTPLLAVELRQLGGAVAAAPAHPSALCHRDAGFTVLTLGLALPGAPDAGAAGEAVLDALRDWSHPGALPNFAGGDDPARFARCYDDETRTRLRDLGDRYDRHRVLATGRVVRG